MAKDTAENIEDVLRASTVPMSAGDIAKKLGKNKKDINRVLYQMTGIVEKAGEETPPRWKLKEDGTASERPISASAKVDDTTTKGATPLSYHEATVKSKIVEILKTSASGQGPRKMSTSEGLRLQQLNEVDYHYTVIIDDSLFMWGGEEPGLPPVHDSNEKRTFTSRLKVFHLPSGQWIIKTTSGNPPLGVMGYSCSTVGDKIYYFGGYCGHDDCYHNSLNELDTVTLTWKQLQCTDDNIFVMKRAYGGMITVEDSDETSLLMTGGYGSPPTVQLQQAQYIQSHSGLVRTNECNMYNILTGEWTTPSNVGECMPPTSLFVIENITKNRAIIYGGLINEGYDVTSTVYIIDIRKKAIYWQSIKVSDSIDQSWPGKRHGHASCIINGSEFVVMGGLNENNQLLRENCCWLFNVSSHLWKKINLPQSVSERYDHSLSVYTVGLNCVWIVVTGGCAERHKETIDGVVKYRGTYVSHPNIAMVIELVFNNDEWSAGFVLDSNGISWSYHQRLDQLYKQKTEPNKEQDVQYPSKELQHSLLHDLQVSQHTIKSLQEALLVAEQREQVSTNSELQKLVQEKDNHIAKLTLKQAEKDKQIAELTCKLENKPSIDSSQLVHQNVQFTLDDVSKLEVILQPVEDDWYLLGQQLEVEESVLADIHKLQKDVQMKCLLQKWCTEGGTLTKLENVLMEMGKKDLISGLHDLVVTRTDVGVQFNYLIPSTDCLSDVHIAGKKLFLIHGDVPQLLNWEEFGLRIGVLKGTLPSSETAEVAVVALVGGQFVFPKNTLVVSAIYAVAVSKPLLQPLRLDLQHCVNLVRPSQTRHLKFAIAPVNTPSLPYEFSPVEGGEFIVNSYYGSIYRSKFCLVGIVAEDGTLPVPTLEEETLDEQGPQDGDANNSTDTENEEEQQTGDTFSDDEKDTSSSDSESTQSNGSVKMKDTQTQEATVSTAVEICSVSDEVKPKVVESSLQVSSVEESSELKTDKSDSTGIISTDLSYIGMVYYEEKRVEDLVTFAASKNLNALLQYIETKHSNAEIDQCIEFCFKPSCDFIELIFDAPQDDPCNGWFVKPRKKPCKKYIDQFGTKERPIPPSCLISVYSNNSTDTVPVLNYGIPLEGINPLVTVYIHRALRQHSIEVHPLASTGAIPVPMDIGTGEFASAQSRSQQKRSSQYSPPAPKHLKLNWEDNEEATVSFSTYSNTPALYTPALVAAVPTTGSTEEAIDATVACKVLSDDISTIIKSQINLPSVIDYLIAKEIVNDVDKKRIMALINIDNKWRELLDLVQATIELDEEVFLIFLDAIKDGGTRREKMLADKLYKIYKKAVKN